MSGLGGWGHWRWVVGAGAGRWPPQCISEGRDGRLGGAGLAGTSQEFDAPPHCLRRLVLVDDATLKTRSTFHDSEWLSATVTTCGEKRSISDKRNTDHPSAVR